MLRIALDTNGEYTTQAGVARYIKGLRQGFDSVPHPDLEILPFAWEVTNYEYRQPRRALRTFYRELIWAKSIARIRLAKEKYDLLHSTSGVLVEPPGKLRHVATVHDLAVLHQRNRFRKWQRFSAIRRLKYLSKVDKIVCISQFTADECMRHLEIPASRMEVIHNGCDFHPSENKIAEANPSVEIPERFFLFVGSLEPGKNLGLLREVYDLDQQSPKSLPPLVIVGARWEGVKHEGAPPPSWIFLGRQSDEVLVFLYKRAIGLLFPSLYEGFGLPVVEAMSLGCPVICSPLASLPEIAGKAALFVSPIAKEYHEAMRRLMTTPSLRQELIGLGKRHADRFSWSQCAQKTLDVYLNVL